MLKSGFDTDLNVKDEILTKIEVFLTHFVHQFTLAKESTFHPLFHSQNSNRALFLLILLRTLLYGYREPLKLDQYIDLNTISKRDRPSLKAIEAFFVEKLLRMAMFSDNTSVLGGKRQILSQKWMRNADCEACISLLVGFRIFVARSGSNFGVLLFSVVIISFTVVSLNLIINPQFQTADKQLESGA